ncbi:hypothetical protein GOBAR_DD19841 [Gossypium barbadense]|nr:hypothetical protein GOBAR_DD19841 [Gossypium barbadense]
MAKPKARLRVPAGVLGPGLWVGFPREWGRCNEKRASFLRPVGPHIVPGENESIWGAPPESAVLDLPTRRLEGVFRIF